MYKKITQLTPPHSPLLLTCLKGEIFGKIILSPVHNLTIARVIPIIMFPQVQIITLLSADLVCIKLLLF